MNKYELLLTEYSQMHCYKEILKKSWCGIVQKTVEMWHFKKSKNYYYLIIMHGNMQQSVLSWIFQKVTCKILLSDPECP